MTKQEGVQAVAGDEVVGTFTVLDMIFFVAACSISALLIRELAPDSPSVEDYLVLTAVCGPAGLSVFGPWAIRRQFIDSRREELEPGEWLWIGLGGGWLAATPMVLVTGGDGAYFFALLVAIVSVIPSLIAFVQTLPGLTKRPWTHWVGILLCFAHAMPLLMELAPSLNDAIENIMTALFYSGY